MAYYLRILIHIVWCKLCQLINQLVCFANSQVVAGVYQDETTEGKQGGLYYVSNFYETAFKAGVHFGHQTRRWNKMANLHRT